MAKRPRERIYIIPRWSGLVFSFGLLVVFALGFGVPYASELTRTLVVALVVAGLVALIQSNDNLRGISIIQGRAAPVPAGHEPVLELVVKNSAQRERIGLWTQEGMPWLKAWRKKPRTASLIPVLEGGDVTTVQLRIRPTKRGRYRMPELWVGSIMPMGLCFAWKTFRDLGEYYVYPKPAGLPLETDHNRRGVGLQGGENGGSQDVSGHRPYEMGDPLSRMDWRVYARTGKLAVRTLEEERSGEVSLRWEDTQHLSDEEARLEQLSFWIAQCVREGRRFQLDLGPSRLELNNNHLNACYEALAVFRESDIR